jgi:hypothetical protein
MLTARSLCFLLLLTWLLLAPAAFGHAQPAAGFELDLQDLKKPAAPAAVKKKKSTPVARTKATVKTTGRVSDTKAPALLQHIEKPQSPVMSELALKATDPCQLAERLAVAVAHRVPEQELLYDLDLKPVAAVTFGGLRLLVVCNLAAAEAYTYRRLLADHGVELVTIASGTAASVVTAVIADALGISYQLQQEILNGELSYLFPAEFERKRPLKLTIQP